MSEPPVRRRNDTTLRRATADADAVAIEMVAATEVVALSLSAPGRSGMAPAVRVVIAGCGFSAARRYPNVDSARCFASAQRHVKATNAPSLLGNSGGCGPADDDDRAGQYEAEAGPFGGAMAVTTVAVASAAGGDSGCSPSDRGRGGDDTAVDTAVVAMVVAIAPGGADVD